MGLWTKVLFMLPGIILITVIAIVIRVAIRSSEEAESDDDDDDLEYGTATKKTSYVKQHRGFTRGNERQIVSIALPTTGQTLGSRHNDEKDKSPFSSYTMSTIISERWSQTCNVSNHLSTMDPILDQLWSKELKRVTERESTLTYSSCRKTVWLATIDCLIAVFSLSFKVSTWQVHHGALVSGISWWNSYILKAC